MANPEVIHPNSERSVETSNAAAERSAELDRSREKGIESPEHKAERVENARREAKEVIAKEASKETRQATDSTAPRAVRNVARSEKGLAYKQTMQQIRAEMSAPERTFSKLIHNPFVERSSEVIGGTLARPNAILAGSTTALVLVILTYIIARTFGYQLSGFETIGSFLAGWVLGLAYDYVRVMALGRRS